MWEKLTTGSVGIGGTLFTAHETFSSSSFLGVITWDINGWQFLATMIVAIPTGLWMWRQLWMSFCKKDKS